MLCYLKSKSNCYDDKSDFILIISYYSVLSLVQGIPKRIYISEKRFIESNFGVCDS